MPPSAAQAELPKVLTQATKERRKSSQCGPFLDMCCTNNTLVTGQFQVYLFDNTGEFFETPTGRIARDFIAPVGSTLRLPQASSESFGGESARGHLPSRFVGVLIEAAELHANARGHLRKDP